MDRSKPKKQQKKNIWSNIQTPHSSYNRLSRKFRKIAAKIRQKQPLLLHMWGY